MSQRTDGQIQYLLRKKYTTGRFTTYCSLSLCQFSLLLYIAGDCRSSETFSASTVKSCLICSTGIFSLIDHRLVAMCFSLSFSLEWQHTMILKDITFTTVPLHLCTLFISRLVYIDIVTVNKLHVIILCSSYWLYYIYSNAL